MLLYSWGANSFGQLGQGRKCEEVRSPVRVDLVDELNTSTIISIEVGGNQSFLITVDGLVYGCGLNNVGQLGIANSEEHNFIRMYNLRNYKVLQLSCKWDTCYAITDNYNCIAWGGNKFGQLGLSPSQLKYSKDALTLCRDAKQVASGLRHCAILLNNGIVITAGSGKRGQLGRKYIEDNCTFDFVEDLTNVSMIASGQNFSLALTEDCKLFGWGCNKFGQLGLCPEHCQYTIKPLQIDIARCLSKFSPSKQHIVIKCGWTHCILHVGDKLFAWGRNNYGQIGKLDPSTSYFANIVEVLPEDIVTDIAVGAEHNLIITDNGLLKTWGWNEHGSCGNDKDIQSLLQPSLINIGSRVRLIGAGSGHSFCLLE